MSEWLVTFSKGKPATVEEADLNAATAWASAQAEASKRDILSVVLVPPASEALASGLAKLVALGLTADEAAAVASPSLASDTMSA